MRRKTNAPVDGRGAADWCLRRMVGGTILPLITKKKSPRRSCCGGSTMKDDTPPSRRKLNVTFFRNYKATTLTAKNIAIEDLRELILTKTASTKEKLPWLKLATFGDQKTDEGSLRHNANVLSIDGLEADYDEEQISFGEAVAIIQRRKLKGAALYVAFAHSRKAPLAYPCTTVAPALPAAFAPS